MAQSTSIGKYFAQIVYPDALVTLQEASYLIGWSSEQFQCCIACAIPKSSCDYSTLEQAVQDVYANNNFILSKSRKFMTPPIVLGEWQPSLVSLDYTPETQHQQSGIWVILSLEPTSTGNHPNEQISSIENEFIITSPLARNSSKFQAAMKVKLHSIFSLGYRYDSSSSYLISYARPDTDQLHCIATEFTDDRFDDAALSRRQLQSIHTEKLHRNARGLRKEQTELKIIVTQINAASDLQKFVLFCLNNRISGGHLKASSKSPPHKVASRPKYGIWILSLPGHLVHTISCNLHKIVTQQLSTLTKWNKLSSWNNLVPAIAQRNQTIHDTFMQQGITLHLTSYFCHELSEKCSNVHDLLRYCAIFTVCWNINTSLRKMLWIKIHAKCCVLVADIVLGAVIGYLMFAHADYLITTSQEVLYKITQYALFDQLTWFNNAPGGVKLNPMITQKLRTLVRFLVTNWIHFLLDMKYFYKAVHMTTCYLGVFGFTVQLSFIADLLRVITLPSYLLHILCTHQYSFHLEILSSLWLLFRGQKHNILHNRVDSCEYNQSQLLFGVMLFAIMLFALPNFTAYYYLFVILRLFLIVVIKLIWHVIIFVKGLPLAQLILYIVDPTLLLEKVYLQLVLVRQEMNVIRAIPPAAYSTLPPDGNMHQQASPSTTTVLERDSPSEEELSDYMDENEFLTSGGEESMDNSKLDISSGYPSSSSNTPSRRASGNNTIIDLRVLINFSIRLTMISSSLRLRSLGLKFSWYAFSNSLRSMASKFSKV